MDTSSQRVTAASTDAGCLLLTGVGARSRRECRLGQRDHVPLSRLPIHSPPSGWSPLREDTVEDPMTAVEDKLFLAELVDNMRQTMLASEAATTSDLDEIRADVEWATRDPERVFYRARIHQVWGRRPD
jgi:hypothetical protein